MRKILVGTCGLFLFGCETEKICYRENCFVTETLVTIDMQKIANVVLRYYREKLSIENEKKLKIVQIACELFGKDNKKLNKELDKINKFYDNEEKHRQSKKLRKDLKKSLKGLKFNYKQVLSLAKEMEKTYTIVAADNEKAYTSYKNRALEIIKFIDSKDEAKDDWTYSHYEDDIQFWNRFEIYWQMKFIISNCYNKFSSYASLIKILSDYINDGTLEDSFLKQHPSSLKPKDEEAFTYGVMPSVWGIVPPSDKNGLAIFDALKNAVANEQLRKTELQEIVSLAAEYMRSLAANIVEIQHDITDKIDHKGYLEQYAEEKLNNFYNYDRYFITDLVRKYPKLEDFERESGKIAVRLAYQTYYQVNIARFLYKEWQDIYLPLMDKFFRNSAILAERLYGMSKNEIISDDVSEKRRYEHENNMRNIAVIKEITQMGTKKILSIPDCYIDSEKEIRDSYNARFMKLRKAYLNNLKKR